MAPPLNNLCVHLLFEPKYTKGDYSCSARPYAGEAGLLKVAF